MLTTVRTKATSINNKYEQYNLPRLFTDKKRYKVKSALLMTIFLYGWKKGHVVNITLFMYFLSLLTDKQNRYKVKCALSMSIFQRQKTRTMFLVFVGQKTLRYKPIFNVPPLTFEVKRTNRSE